MNLHTLYRSLLDPSRPRNSRAVSAALQNRIFDHSLAKQDWETMVLLASYPHLDIEVDTRIRTLDQVDVLRAWATRPGRTSAELVERVSKDKRVSVVLPLAAMPNLDAAVYQTLAKVKSPKLAAVLAGNASAPDAVRVAKLKEFLRTPPRGARNRHQDAIHTICRAHIKGNEQIVATMYETVAENTFSVPWVLACLQENYVRAGDIQRWVDNLTEVFDSDDGAWYWQNGDVLRNLVTKAADARQRDKIVAAGVDYVSRHGGVTWRVSGLNSALNEIASADAETDTLLEELNRETSPERCDELAQAIRSTIGTKDLKRLVRALARHRHAPLTTIMAYLPQLVGHDHGSEYQTLVRRLEKESYEHLATVVDQYRSRGAVYTPAPVRWLAEPETFHRWYADRELAAGRTLPDWFTETKLVQDDPDYAIKALHWSRLANVAGQLPGLGQRVEERILDRLGDDPARWEAFTTLGADFEGTLEDLLEAAATL